MGKIIDVDILSNKYHVPVHFVGDKSPEKENKILSIIINSPEDAGDIDFKDLKLLLTNSENVIIFNNNIHRLQNSEGSIKTYTCYLHDMQAQSILSINVETRSWNHSLSHIIQDVSVGYEIVHDLTEYRESTFTMSVDSDSVLCINYTPEYLNIIEKTLVKDIELKK